MVIERKKLPISVLIVDDEPSILEQLVLILGRRVDVFFTAHNGAEGFERYKKESPDLIISDIDMPIMNGIEFLKLVRADNVRIPFILSTGLKSLDILMDAIEHGITAFLPKPLQVHNLIAKLEEVARTKELELDAKKSAALLDEYKKIVDDSVIVSKADTNGIITYVNDMFCLVSGYDREELIGQPHNIVRDPSMPSSVYKELWETIQSKQIWHGIIHNRTKSGKRYTVKSTIAPVIDNDGNIVEYIALREDITELESSREQAKLLAKVKGDFLANMSHEIRTPMNGILGFMDLLARSDLNEQQKRYVGIINNSTKTLLGIVNDVLDFSKIESGKLELNCIEVNPIVVFNDIAELYTASISEKNITFDVSIDPNLGEVISIDLLRIQQIISNLLSNAVKFTPEGGHIIFYVNALDDSTIRLGVKDNGIGIAASSKNTIFDAFSQADSSTTRKFGGTGLGLSISSALVALMGGELQVESQEGVGSNFYFDIKINKNEKLVNISSAMVQNFHTIFTGKVLVAEDNDVNQLLIEEYLKNYNLDYKIVDNGEDAVKELLTNTYDIVLMDVNMPVMNGIDAMKIIKERGMRTSIIAMTANAMAGDKERFGEIGFDGYLSKPFSVIELEKIFSLYLFEKTNEKISPDFHKSSSKSAVDHGSMVDIELLKKELDLPDKIIYKLLFAFLKSSDANLSDLEAGIHEKNFSKIEHAAHKIKGAAGNMRFFILADISGQIEASAKSGSDEDYDEAFYKVKEIMGKIQEEIKMFESLPSY